MPALVERYGNEAQTQLNGGIDASQTLIEVDAAGLPFPQAPQFRIRIDNEYMIVIAGAGTTLWTVIRGVEGSTAATHADNALVTHIVTGHSLRALTGAAWGPIDGQLQGSTTAVDNATGGVQLSTEVNYWRMPIRRPIVNASKVWLGVTTAGNTLTHAWVAFYDFDGVTKLAEATGLMTTWQSTGVKSFTFDSGATFSYDGEGLIVAVNAAGTTRPSMGGVTVSAQVTPNIGPSAGIYQRSFRGSGALTTPPASVSGSVGINSVVYIGLE